MDWLTEFPELGRRDLAHIRRTLDEAYRGFSSSYGEAIEAFFDPLLHFLIFVEDLLIASPWWLVIFAVAAISYIASRSKGLVVGVIVAFLLIGTFGMWEDTMSTLGMITVCTLLAIAIGVPIGIGMALSSVARFIITPILDVMQTMPAFVYLIPVVMLLGLGKVPGLIAVVIYAIPPVIRLTDLGIRMVDKEVMEAADAFGSTAWQKLIKVQIPLAMPNIMAGVNQTIMMALAMVVIASMIGVAGLGRPVLQSINNQFFTLGLMNGLAIVALAIIFDRVSQAYAKRVMTDRGMTTN